MLDSPSIRHKRRLTVHRVVVCVFWLLEFIATHAPLTEQVDALPGSDKHLHFVAYFVLAGLLMFWNGISGAATVGKALRVILILSVYAAIDELLQPLVRREADVLDWAADVIGAIAGAMGGYAFARVLCRWRRD